jgi:hypothetical protein
VMAGIPSNLIEHMALKALQRDAETRFSLEDVFDSAHTADEESSAAKLVWVNGWRNLPHIAPEIQAMYAYPQSFAEEIYNRIERELSRCDSNPGACDALRTGRLHISSRDDDSAMKVPARYFVSSDRQIVAAQKAEFCDRAELLRHRQEGHFLVSYETPRGWIALRKELLTEILGAGRDATIAGLPADAAAVLRLMCPGQCI